MLVELAFGWAYNRRGGTRGEEPCVKVDSESWLDADSVLGRGAFAVSDVRTMGELKGLLGE